MTSITKTHSLQGYQKIEPEGYFLKEGNHFKEITYEKQIHVIHRIALAVLVFVSVITIIPYCLFPQRIQKIWKEKVIGGMDRKIVYEPIQQGASTSPSRPSKCPHHSGIISEKRNDIAPPTHIKSVPCLLFYHGLGVELDILGRLPKLFHSLVMEKLCEEVGEQHSFCIRYATAEEEMSLPPESAGDVINGTVLLKKHAPNEKLIEALLFQINTLGQGVEDPRAFTSPDEFVSHMVDLDYKARQSTKKSLDALVETRVLDSHSYQGQEPTPEDYFKQREQTNHTNLYRGRWYMAHTHLRSIAPLLDNFNENVPVRLYGVALVDIKIRAKLRKLFDSLIMEGLCKEVAKQGPFCIRYATAEEEIYALRGNAGHLVNRMILLKKHIPDQELIEVLLLQINTLGQVKGVEDPRTFKSPDEFVSHMVGLDYKVHQSTKKSLDALVETGVLDSHSYQGQEPTREDYFKQREQTKHNNLYRGRWYIARRPLQFIAHR